MIGIVFLDKPQQMTSFVGCAVCRRLFSEKRVGHAGTLDPMATGVLPVFLGRATRLISHLPDHDKTYVAHFRFGAVSDTLDVWGKVTETHLPLPTKESLLNALSHFQGEILQVPPMVSARRHQGKRLYELAREGVEVERQARPTTIYRLELLHYHPETGQGSLLCSCSQGTYIRTLCDDLGRELGCGAVMTALRRIRAAGVEQQSCVTPAVLEQAAAQGNVEQYLLPADVLLQAYPAVTVSAAQATRFCNGGELDVARLPYPVEGKVRVYAPDNRFIGLGETENNQLKVLVVL